MTKEVSLFSKGALPAHLSKLGGLGNENVQLDDLAVPRINLLQQLSPQVQKSKPEFIAGAEAGMFHNSVTNELYASIYVINLFYHREIAAFRKRPLGGGFLGNYPTLEAAQAKVTADNVPLDHVDFVDSANHTLLLLDEKGQPKTQALMSLNGTKMRVSNQWNSEIQLLDPNAPRFGSVWLLSTVLQSNAKGSWHNLKVDFAGWAPAELTEEAAKLYTTLTGKAATEVENAA